MELIKGDKIDEAIKSKSKLDMVMSRIPKRNIQTMDVLAKMVGEIFKFVDNEIATWVVDEKDQNIRNRILRELELGNTHLEDALSRFCRGTEHVNYPVEKGDKNGN